MPRPQLASPWRLRYRTHTQRGESHPAPVPAPSPLGPPAVQPALNAGEGQLGRRSASARGRSELPAARYVAFGNKASSFIEKLLFRSDSLVDELDLKKGLLIQSQQ